MTFVRAKFLRIISSALLAAPFASNLSSESIELGGRVAVERFWNGAFPERLLDAGEFVVVNAFHI
jgi:hypothetical protein